MIDLCAGGARPAVSFLPTTAVLEMTYRCNHRCLFCSCPWENPAGKLRKGRELGAEEWEEAIRAVSALGAANLCFTGGEALLRDDLWRIIRYARGLNDEKIVCRDGAPVRKREPLRLFLISNGRAVTRQVLESCRDCGVQLSLSLPGLRSFPELTGGGDPDKVLEVFAAAKALGLFTVVNVTVTKKNLHELYETIAAAFLAGAGQLLLNVFLRGGRGLEHGAELALEPAQIRSALDEAERVLESAGRFGAVGTELPRCVLAGKKYERLEVASRCAAAAGFFVIGPSGRVRVCNHSETELVHYRELENLKMDPYWMRFARKEYLPRKCYACAQAGSCDGGCREEAHIVRGGVDSEHEFAETLL